MYGCFCSPQVMFFFQRKLNKKIFQFTRFGKKNIAVHRVSKHIAVWRDSENIAEPLSDNIAVRTAHGFWKHKIRELPLSVETNDLRYFVFRDICVAHPVKGDKPNRLSSTINGNRKIDQLRTTSYVSNEKRKTTWPLISLNDFQDSVEINVVFVGIRKKYLQLKIT